MELAIRTKTVGSLAQSFKSSSRKLENKLILQSDTKPREWKRYNDDAFYLWAYTARRTWITLFDKQAKTFHTLL